MATGSFQVFDVTTPPTGSINPVVLTQVLDVGVPLTFIGTVGTYTQQVSYSSLVNGGITINHQLDKTIASIIVWINNTETVSPDRFTNLDSNNVFVELLSYADPSNTFTIILI